MTQPNLPPTSEITACRGAAGECPHSLASMASLQDELARVVAESRWDGFLRAAVKGPILPHYRLKIALAACPNACTQPQIKDIGIIASVRPRMVSDDCTGCGECERACGEDAIAVVDGRAALRMERCVGCGACVRQCPEDALASDGTRFRLLLGGRMGRHPRWATEIAELCEQDLPGAVAAALSLLIERDRPGERFAEMVDRLGVEVFAGGS